MILLHTIKDLKNLLQNFKTEGKKIGFVPTMGALHAGHLSLVDNSVKENDTTVVSIFVNPTQFNDKADLEKYPRTLDADCELLNKNKVDIVFAPSVEEIYPEPDTRVFDFGNIDKVMEGAHRPGHFNGVAQVVSRLFDIVEPDNAYFGEKDFQQIAVIKDMVRQLATPLKIVTVPIVREDSGLALSSRNQRLSVEQKQNATNIYKNLTESKEAKLSVKETIDFVSTNINNIEGLTVEYFDIVDGNSLKSINSWDDTSYAVGCIAVFCGEVRLIDNITYKKDNEN